MRDPPLAARNAFQHAETPWIRSVAVTDWKAVSQGLNPHNCGFYDTSKSQPDTKQDLSAAYKAQRADFFRNLLVDPINNACSEVEWCQVPVRQVNLRVGDFAQANAKVMSSVKVESTCDCPLAAKAFDWLRVVCSRNRRIQVPPPIPGAPKNGYVGREGPIMQR